MVDAEPRVFDIGEQDGAICLSHVAMHRAFETDKAGTTTVHVWLSAQATPDADDFETIEADVEFTLFDGDRRIGTCKGETLRFEDKDDRLDILADDGLRIAAHEGVTHIEVGVDAAVVTRSKTKLTLEAAKL